MEEVHRAVWAQRGLKEGFLEEVTFKFRHGKEEVAWPSRKGRVRGGGNSPCKGQSGRIQPACPEY